MKELVDKANAKEQKRATVSHIGKNFVRAGTKPPVKRHKSIGSRGMLLRGATDWKVLVDLDNKMVVPTGDLWHNATTRHRHLVCRDQKSGER